MLVPLGRVRWVRYELDYTLPATPYLVRYDFIDAQPGEALPAMAPYPGCTGGGCPFPMLHLPDSRIGPVAVSIAPMVEDLQIAVGCDGWADPATWPPDLPAPYAAGQEGSPDIWNGGPLGPPIPAVPDRGTETGPRVGFGNRIIDEYTGPNAAVDEWYGNHIDDQAAPGPDCVWYGPAASSPAAPPPPGQGYADWRIASGASGPGVPVFQISPQALRVSLIGAAEFGSVLVRSTDVAGVGIPTTMLPALEDRDPVHYLSTAVAPREHFVVTERFVPANLRYRDPRVP